MLLAEAILVEYLIVTTHASSLFPLNGTVVVICMCLLLEAVATVMVALHVLASFAFIDGLFFLGRAEAD
jgi:hypothetical protein